MVIDSEWKRNNRTVSAVCSADTQSRLEGRKETHQSDGERDRWSTDKGYRETQPESGHETTAAGGSERSKRQQHLRYEVRGRVSREASCKLDGAGTEHLFEKADARGQRKSSALAESPFPDEKLYSPSPSRVTNSDPKGRISTNYAHKLPLRTKDSLTKKETRGV